MPDRSSRPSTRGRSPSLFTRLAQAVSSWAGKPVTFCTAAGLIVLWAASGPIFGFNDTWQLVINTSTTIITFLMVFVIQNSQNRDTAAMQIKLDELLSKLDGAREELMDLEQLDETDIEAIRSDYRRRAELARQGKDPDARPRARFRSRRSIR